MKVRTQFAGVALLIVLGLLPAWAAPGSVAGLVRNSAGVPQIGAEVQLLRPDLSVVASVYTNAQGRFAIASILPGRYALKAMDTSFLPSLRDDVRVRNGQTIVNLTLNTLYEVMQWLPAEPRSSGAQNDDWQWTLRSAADRPLLRWLEDGPLVVVSDGKGSAPKLKARLMATGSAGTFGESGERITASLKDTPVNSRELLAQVDFSPDSNAGMESMLGFSQDLGFAGAVQSLAAIDIHPELEGVGAAGLQEASFDSRETLHLGDMADAEVGATEAMVRTSSGMLTQSLPYADAAWHSGNVTIRYRLMTEVPEAGDAPAAPMPRVATRDGGVVVEHGVHNEIGVERNTAASDMAVRVYAERVENPVLEASAHWGPGANAAQMGVLFDPHSHLARVSGQAFSSTGVEASVEHRLPGASRVRASYTNGMAMVMPALPQSVFEEVMTAAHARRVQSYAISLSGTLDGTGTRWRASYRWQPEDTVTEVEPFAMEAIAPYLNLHLVQSVHEARDGSTGLEALVEVQNLLAEGYHPYLLSDGSTLVFAQDQRALRAGLVFTF
jgi:hypothetical protein